MYMYMYNIYTYTHTYVHHIYNIYLLLHYHLDRRNVVVENGVGHHLYVDLANQ